MTLKSAVMELERTLVLIKPDGLQRGLVGQILSRFELVGLKIVGLKLIAVDPEFAARHYTEDLAKRRGQKIRQQMVKMLTEGPVVAIALEGIEAIELVRKMVGPTEPKAAPPGTIRGDFAHISYRFADGLGRGIRNLIHASSSVGDSSSELALWFAASELYQYEAPNDRHIFSRE